MALKSTIYKIDLQLADIDHHAYQQHSLTLAKHPSETDERLMVRFLAFALYAYRAPDAMLPLRFAKGLSDTREPDVWQKDLTGAVHLWIEVGQPSEKDLRKVCSKAKEVGLLLYGARTAELWWQQNCKSLQNLPNLGVIHLPDSSTLSALADRNMRLSCMVQEGVVHLNGESGSAEIPLGQLKAVQSY